MRITSGFLAVLSLVVSIIVTGCSANEKADSKTQCSDNYDALKSEVRKLSGDKNYEAAQDVLSSNERCYKHNDRYWALRASSLPKDAKVGSRKERKYSTEALNYLDKAIQIAPGNNAYYVFKAYFLIGANQLQKGVDLYDEQLKKSVVRFDDGDQRSVADALLLEDSDYYIYGANQIYNMKHAEDSLSPYLAHACSDAPLLRKRYADSIIAIRQVFDGVNQPKIPQEKADKEKALKKACAGFRQHL